MYSITILVKCITLTRGNPTSFLVCEKKEGQNLHIAYLHCVASGIKPHLSKHMLYNTIPQCKRVKLIQYKDLR